MSAHPDTIVGEAGPDFTTWETRAMNDDPFFAANLRLECLRQAMLALPDSTYEDQDRVVVLAKKYAAFVLGQDDA